MTRTYELALVVEPRKSEDEVQAIANQFKVLIESAGGNVDEVDHWGKRKLAYPIEKFNEASYVFLYAAAEDGLAWGDIERRALQDEAILRHLVVRTDPDLKRAERKAKVKPKRIRAADEREERPRRDRDGREGREGRGDRDRGDRDRGDRDRGDRDRGDRGDRDRGDRGDYHRDRR